MKPTCIHAAYVRVVYIYIYNILINITSDAERTKRHVGNFIWSDHYIRIHLYAVDYTRSDARKLLSIRKRIYFYESSSGMSVCTCYEVCFKKFS